MSASPPKPDPPTAANAPTAANTPTTASTPSQGTTTSAPANPSPGNASQEPKKSFFRRIFAGEAPDTTDTSLRYAAYANRVNAIVRATPRYVAYTSDIGESFRPVVDRWVVRGAYGVSWAYIIGDVASEGYKAYAIKKENGGVKALDDWKAVVAQRAVFQTVASMALPAFTIHSIVKYSGKALKKYGVKGRLGVWTPIALGMSAVPVLPYIFDHPVEKAVEGATQWTYEKVTGHDGSDWKPGEHRHKVKKE